MGLRRRRRPATRPRVLAESDCERCRSGLVSQPVNAASSLAYVAVGWDLHRRDDTDRPFAWAVVAVGVGSVAYHGPGGVLGRWLHDASLLAMLGLLTLSDATVAEGRPMPPRAVRIVVGGAAVLAHPRTSAYAQGAAGVTAAVAEARRHLQPRADRVGRAGWAGWREALVTTPLMTAGIVAHLMGRTGQPWCRPDSFVQAHAAWHVLSAAALWTRRRF